MKEALEKIDRFIFSEASAKQLGFCRLIFFSYLIFLFSSRDWSIIAWYPKELWFPPSPLGILQNAVGSETQMKVTAFLFRLSLLGSAVGLLTRFNTLIAFFLGSYLLALEQSFGYVGHTAGPIALALVVFAVSPCGDDLSVDRLIRNKLSNRALGHGWPIRLLELILVSVFVSAGLSKLINSGWGWVAGDHMTYLFHERLIRHPNLPRIVYWLEDSSFAASVLGGLALCLQLATPALWAGPTCRGLILIGLCVFQIFNVIALGVHGDSALFSWYLMLFPWKKAYQKLLNSLTLARQFKIGERHLFPF